MSGAHPTGTEGIERSRDRALVVGLFTGGFGLLLAWATTSVTIPLVAPAALLFLAVGAIGVVGALYLNSDVQNERKWTLLGE